MTITEINVKSFKPIDKRKKTPSKYVYWKRPSSGEWEIFEAKEFERYHVLNKWLETDDMYYAYPK